MSYFEQVSISGSDSPTIDAFGRIRVSNPLTLFGSKLLTGKESDKWAEKLTGGASATHNTNQSSVTLTVPATTIASAIRQSKRRFNYQPGKSSLIFVTGIIGNAVSGITKRIGYFDSDNGLFFQSSGSSVSVVKRSYTSGSAVDTVVNQTNWNLDTMNGSGPSGILLDFTKTQIMVVDIEWLGVGRVRAGFVIDGIVIYCHQFVHANIESLVYMSSPNLPVRSEISNDGTGISSSVTIICASVLSEGGSDVVGFPYAADRGTSGYATGNNSNLHPIMSLRLKSGHSCKTVSMRNITIAGTSSTAQFRWGLYVNPTIAGVDGAVWVSAASESAIEYDISRSTSNLVSGGVLLSSGYSSEKLDQPHIHLSDFALGVDVDDVSDQLVLAIQNTPAALNTYYASINWYELS